MTSARRARRLPARVSNFRRTVSPIELSADQAEERHQLSASRRGRPRTGPAEDAASVAEYIRQITPWLTGAHDPQHTLDEPPVCLDPTCPGRVHFRRFVSSILALIIDLHGVLSTWIWVLGTYLAKCDAFHSIPEIQVIKERGQARAMTQRLADTNNVHRRTTMRKLVLAAFAVLLALATPMAGNAAVPSFSDSTGGVQGGSTG